MDAVETFIQMDNKARVHDPLVVISVVKSDNTNMVVYQAKLNEDKTAFSDDTPHGYWQTWEETLDGQPTHHSLGFTESRLAFGTVVERISETEIGFTLKGYPKLPITCKLVDGEIETTILFGGMEYLLVGIYVHIKGRPTNPAGISLMAKIRDMEGSPILPIYIDRNTTID